MNMPVEQGWKMDTSHSELDASPTAARLHGPAKAARRPRTLRTVLTGILGGIAGVAPHVLHHIGPLVGTALVAGMGGTILFGVLGLAASVPMLLSLRRRFKNWWAPGIALGFFVLMFLLSSLVIGPLISAPSSESISVVPTEEHGTHHP